MQLGLVVGILEKIPLVFSLEFTIISAVGIINSIGYWAPMGFPQSALADIEAHVFKLEDKNINGGVGP